MTRSPAPVGHRLHQHRFSTLNGHLPSSTCSRQNCKDVVTVDPNSLYSVTWSSCRYAVTNILLGGWCRNGKAIVTTKENSGRSEDGRHQHPSVKIPFRSCPLTQVIVRTNVKTRLFDTPLQNRPQHMLYPVFQDLVSEHSRHQRLGDLSSQWA
jgi:hypothetical protein